MSKPHSYHRPLIIVIACWLVLGVGGAIALRSGALDSYVLHAIQRSAREKAGLDIRVQKVRLGFLPLTLELGGIDGQRIGSVPPTEPVLLHADRLRVQVGLQALLHKRVDIQELVIDRLAGAIRTEADGQSNLPTPPPSNTSQSSSFTFQIGHLALNDAYVQFDDRQIPLSADLRGLKAQMAFNDLTNTYQGEIGYDSGRLQTPGIREFEHHASAKFDADARHLKVERLNISTMRSRIDANGVLTDFANPVFIGEYTATLIADDIRRIMPNSAAPSGEISLNGKLNYRTTAGPTWAERAAVQGQLESGKLLVASGASRGAIQDLRGNYRLENGRLIINNLRADAFGGKLASEPSVIDLVRNSGNLHLTVRNASVQQIVQTASPSSRPPATVAANADLDVDASWKKSVSAVTAKINGVLRRSTDVTIAGAIPVDGHFAFDYDAAHNRASFQPSTIRTGATELTASGVASRNSSLHVGLTSTDLHQLSDLIASVLPPATSTKLAQYNVQGAARVNGTVSGNVSDPTLDAQLSLKPLELSGTRLQSVSGHVRANSSALSINDGSIVSERQGRMTFSGQTRLVHGSPDPNGPLSLDARIDQLSAAELQHLARVDYPVQGLLNGEIHVTGSQLHPQAHGHLELAKAQVYGEPLNALSVKSTADMQTIRLDADAQAAAGSLTAHVEYAPSSRQFKISANSRQLTLEKIAALQNSMQDVSGQLAADISGSGTIEDPQLSGRLQIPELHVQGETFHQVEANLDIRNKHSELKLQSNVEKTQLQATASVELTPGYPANIALDTGKVPIGPLLSKFMSPSQQGASGEFEVHAKVHGPLQTPVQLEGSAEIPMLRLQAQNIALANAGPVKINYRAGVLEIAAAELKGERTDIRLSGTIPVQGNANMKATLNGNVDLAILQPWTNGGHSAGRATIQLNAQGPKSKPTVDGNVKVQDAAYTSDAVLVGVESLNADVSIAGNRINVSRLSAKAGGGNVTVTGTAFYGSTSQFNLAMKADSVRIRQSGVRSVLSGDLSWNGTTESSTLAGRVVVDKLAFNQGSDLSEILAGFGDDSTVSEPSAFARGVKLNVSVQSSQNLNLASSQLSMSGSADLMARGSVAVPVILGRVALTGGEVFFLGKRFEIDNGTIAFSNPARTVPVVNLHVKTTVEQYNITAIISGPVDRLKTTYTSDPSLPTADIINLLAFGQTTAESASKGATPASVGAESAVASAVGGQVASRVQSLTGISQLTLNPLAGNQNPGSQVAIQQRVTGNLLLTFSTDVTTTQNQSVQIQYQVQKNVSVSVLRDQNGGYGIDMRYHKDF
jgi:translocation and assembly module TamB